VNQQDVAGGSFDQGADPGAVALADDHITFPMAGRRAILDFGWPVLTA
jgi:hypothetical protein